MNAPSHDKLPLVSIVLPTYNRLHFLDEAIDSINAQTYTHWELILMDDGSTDGTAQAVPRLAERCSGPLHYRQHDNAGPAVTRNRGIAQAAGQYVAFFDSDDLWKPHHLNDCVTGLQACPEVGWAFGAGERVDIRTGKVLRKTSMNVDAKPRPFMQLKHRVVGKLHVVEDSSVLDCITGVDHWGGLQASVLRREVFDTLQIPEARIGEDFGLSVRFAAAGMTFGYIPEVHITYRVHGEHASNAADAPPEKRLASAHEYIRLLELLLKEPDLTAQSRRNLRVKLAKHYFWRLGKVLNELGRRSEARAAMWRGLRADPTKPKLWKSWLASYLRFS